MFKRSAFFLLLAAGMIMAAQNGLQSDVFKSAGGVLRITFIGHASLLFQFKPAHQAADLTIYVDPDGRLADFSQLPKADLILVTHQHYDHFDATAIETLRQAATAIFVSPACLPLPAAARILKNGDRTRFKDVGIEAVPAYNIVNKRPDGLPFHPRGEGNGYVLDFPALRVYVAGDTENIPEMAALKDIAIAFLPMNLPYTMTPEMTAQAARIIMPRVLYPYHYSATDPQRLVTLLKDSAGMDVRIRKLN
jgi:L-ascorbate metabolism protein UlaG (beta-lactamase superfamily)